MDEILAIMEDCFSGVFINPTVIQSVSPVIEYKEYKVNKKGKNIEYISYYFVVYLPNKVEQSAFFKKNRDAETIRSFIIDLIMGVNNMLLEEYNMMDDIYMTDENYEFEEDEEYEEDDNEDVEYDEEYCLAEKCN